MKLNKKLRTFLLIATLSLGIGIVAYAGTTGSRTFSNTDKTKSGNAVSKYNGSTVTATTTKAKAALTDELTVVVTSYDKNGKLLATKSDNDGVVAVGVISPGTNWTKAVSTHAVTNSSFKPYCSTSLTITPK